MQKPSVVTLDVQSRILISGLMMQGEVSLRGSTGYLFGRESGSRICWIGVLAQYANTHLLCRMHLVLPFLAARNRCNCRSDAFWNFIRLAFNTGKYRLEMVVAEHFLLPKSRESINMSRVLDST